jgi:hypothetical protein
MEAAMAEPEPVTPQSEPAPSHPTTAPGDAELSDEQLDQVAGGAIVIEVPRYSGGISTDL